MTNAVPLASLNMAALSSCFHAAAAAHEALTGLYNRPSTSDPAAVWIEAEIERCSDLMQEMANEAERREPLGLVETKLRAQLLVRWGLECGSWVDILNAVHIAQLRAA